MYKNLKKVKNTNVVSNDLHRPRSEKSTKSMPHFFLGSLIDGKENGLGLGLLGVVIGIMCSYSYCNNYT